MLTSRWLHALTQHRPTLQITPLRFAAAASAIATLVAATTYPAHTQSIRSARPHWNPSRFLINEFVVPALEQDQVPLK